METVCMKQQRRATLLGIATLLVVACSSDEEIAGIDGGGARNPVTAQGPIEGFGSIIVNDVHYELSNAQIQVNGRLVSESELALGQLVTVVGSAEQAGSNAVADSVVFESNVHGPVDSLDAMSARLVVMGQAVGTDSSTVFELSSAAPEFASLTEDQVLSVSGFVSADGSIQATRIERLANEDDLRVIGQVAGLDTVSLRFEINGLTISYGSVLLLEGFPSGELELGDEVLVEASGFDQNGWLLAREIRLREPGSAGQAGEEAEVEGLITRFSSPLDFDVSGLAITTSASTRYEGGSEADLQLNVKVEVEGTVDVSGVILASKIEVKDGGAVVGGGGN